MGERPQLRELPMNRVPGSAGILPEIGCLDQQAGKDAGAPDAEVRGPNARQRTPGLPTN